MSTEIFCLLKSKPINPSVIVLLWSTLTYIYNTDTFILPFEALQSKNAVICYCDHTIYINTTPI